MMSWFLKILLFQMDQLCTALHLGELDSLFALEDANKKAGAAKAAGPKKPVAVSLIDAKRSLNISIQLAGIRMPFKTIKAGSAVQLESS
jgi:hypothetical protein